MTNARVNEGIVNLFFCFLFFFWSFQFFFIFNLLYLYAILHYKQTLLILYKLVYRVKHLDWIKLVASSDTSPAWYLQKYL